MAVSSVDQAKVAFNEVFDEIMSSQVLDAEDLKGISAWLRGRMAEVLPVCGEVADRKNEASENVDRAIQAMQAVQDAIVLF